jgi:hypothetical protein
LRCGRDGRAGCGAADGGLDALVDVGFSKGIKLGLVVRARGQPLVTDGAEI